MSARPPRRALDDEFTKTTSDKTVADEVDPAPQPTPPGPGNGPKKRAPAPKTAPATKTAAAAGAASIVRLGLYIGADTLAIARGAYVADFDNRRDGPRTFAAWIDGALTAWANKTPQQRATLAATLTEAGGKAAPRVFLIEQATIDTVKAAMTSDRKAGTVQSRSVWATDAIVLASEQARTRNGGTLPVVTSRLPNGMG